MSSPPRRIGWSFEPDDSRLLRLLSYCSFGVLGGMWVFAGAVAASLFLRGPLPIRGLLAAGFLFAVFVWLTHLRPLFEADGGLSHLEPHWLFVASLFGAGAFSLTLGVGTVLGFLLLFGLIAVPAVLVSALQSTGDIDAEKRTMTYRGREVPLDGLSGVRRLRLGGLTLHWFSYAPGASNITTPRFVVIPTDAAADAKRVFAAAVAAEPSDFERPNPAVRYALAAFGAFFLGFAAVLVVVMPGGEDAAVVKTYALLVFGFVGVGFLGAAAVHG
ncbi:hypothetical protein [Haladaptatus sp. T7]|uniref:hypothetical protein n=1 Tax=Haladaptatus sp. T7 TaxID=2029368 RepID=UPI0021A255DC|nr:hypothetical protein [Haladaptatus sp. T7]GKZ15567.1 hypothetical protein HAL_34480 [Haladaptatus sp. T7]